MARRHHACGIVKMAADDEKRLYAFFGGCHGGWRQVVISTKCYTSPNRRSWVRLSDMNGFHHESELPSTTVDMRFVTTDPYHFMLVGGNTPNWAETSKSNWHRWNDQNLRVVRADPEMRSTPLVAGAWTERKKMYHGGSFLKLADDNKYIKNPEAQNREVRGF